MSQDMFTALADLPSHAIPRGRKSNEVRRLKKLGRLLANDDLDEAAPDKATKKLLDTLPEFRRHEYGEIRQFGFGDL